MTDKNENVTKIATKRGGYMVNNIRFRLFRRGYSSTKKKSKKTQTRFTWSARITNPVTGVEMSPVAVSTLRKKIGSTDRSPIRTRDEAVMIVSKAIELGVIGNNYDPCFIQYCMDYWNIDGQRVKDVLMEDSTALSPNYVRNMGQLIENHIKDIIGPTRKISSIRVTDIDKIKREMLKKKLSAETVRKGIKSISQPLAYAVREGLIPSNPADMVSVRNTNKSDSTRGCYSVAQLKKLLGYLKEHREDGIVAEELYLAVEFSARTGARLGEVQALKKDCITFTKAEVGTSPAIIEINESWATRVGTKSTKSKKSRRVPCPAWLAQDLLSFAEKCPFEGNDFIFWGQVKDKPVSEHTIRDNLHGVLHSLEEEKDEAGLALGFHSLRHAFNTHIRQNGILNDVQLRAIVGHQNESMSDHYTHDDTDSLVKSGVAVEAFFSKTLEA